MSILHYLPVYNDKTRPSPGEEDARYQRDALGDLKHGLDLIFDLKRELDKLHPIANETLIRMCAY